MSGGSYPIIVKDLSGRSVSIVTTGGEYKYVGRLIVEFDKTTGEITKIDPASGPIRVAGGAQPDAVVPDPEVQAQVTGPVQAFVAALETNIIARSEVVLDGMRKNVRSKETNVGNLVADALLSEAPGEAVLQPTMSTKHKSKNIDPFAFLYFISAFLSPRTRCRPAFPARAYQSNDRCERPWAMRSAQDWNVSAQPGL